MKAFNLQRQIISVFFKEADSLSLTFCNNSMKVKLQDQRDVEH